MFCPNCGKKMTDGNTVCENCGYQLSQLQIEALRDFHSTPVTETQKQEEKPSTPEKDEFFETPKTPEPTQNALRVCPYCRSYLPQEVTYCGTCGSYVQQGQTGQPIPPQAPYGYPPAPYAPPIPKKKNTCALVGFIIALVSATIFSGVLGIMGGIASLVLGIIGLVQIKGGKGSGKGLAIAAIVIGAVTILSCAFMMALEASGILDQLYGDLFGEYYPDYETI
ncbi:MAG: zinc ribbon domain-containing protein [Clostridia bacterium]|nr:zinc ribbon domain-containing protein [Clostridia bacterium]